MLAIAVLSFLAAMQIFSPQVTTTGVFTPGHIVTVNSSNGSTVVLQDGGTSTLPILQDSQSVLGADVSLTSGVIASIITKTLTMPSSGCPCRVIVSYELYWTSNNQTFTSWVGDGALAIATSQTTGAGTNTGGLGASQMSQATYANGANVTFTLQAESNGVGATIKAAAAQLPSGITSQNSWLNLSVVGSN